MFTYCSLCSAKLEVVHDEDGEHWLCPACGQTFYHNPRPCVEVALFDTSGRILLSKRGRDPGKGKFDLPGGFITLDETAEQALARELKEELDLDEGDYTKPVYFLSWSADYQWVNVTLQNLVFEFYAELKTGTITPGDDVAGVQFVSPDEIDGIEFSPLKYKEIIPLAAAARKQLLGI